MTAEEYLETQMKNAFPSLEGQEKIMNEDIRQRYLLWYAKVMKVAVMYGEQYAKQEKIKLLEKHSIETKGGKIFKDSMLNKELEQLKQSK